MSLGHPSLTRLSSFFLMLFHCFLTHLQGLSGFVLCWFVVQEAFLIFAVNCTFGLSLHPHYRGFFATMVSADFLPFVVTAEGVSSWLDGSFRWQALPGKVIHLSFHIPAAFTPDSHPQLLRFALYGTLVSVCGLICGSCSSGRNFAAGLLSELLLPVSPLP